MTIALFLFAITGLRLTVYSILRPVEHPPAIEGVLDLRGWDWPSDRTISLNGEWDFYPNQLVASSDRHQDPASNTGNTYIQVPGPWELSFPSVPASSYRYGTYQLRILLDERQAGDFKLRLSYISSAAAVYLNGQLVGSSGHPSDKQGTYTPRKMPFTVNVPAGSQTLDLSIQVANHAGEGGITRPIYFGTDKAIENRILLSMGIQIVLCLVFFIHGVYSLMLFFLGAANRGIIYFTIVMMFAIASVLVADDRLLFVLLPMPFEQTVKISLLSYVGVVIFLPSLLQFMFPEYRRRNLVRLYTIFSLLYALFVLFGPSVYTLPTLKDGSLLAVLLFSVFLCIHILYFAIRKQEDVIYVLLACVSLGTNIVWIVIINRTKLDTYHYPFDLIITVFAFAAFWFKRFIRTGTQAKQLAEKLQLANERKDEFLVTTSHELKNPLHGMMNIAQSILDAPSQPTGDELKNKLKIQVDIAKRMSLLLDDLLDVARLKEETLRLQFQSVNLRSVVTGTVDMIHYMLENKPLALHIEIADRFPSVRADENRLIQILFNLLHNAVKFTDNGSITVRAQAANGEAVIQIIDTGIGMDEETKNRILQPYEQGSADMGETYGGLGLGLTISQQLIQLHGGSLQVASSPGQGSTFSFTLLLADEAETGREADRSASSEPFLAASQDGSGETSGHSRQATGCNPKILAVDDDNLNLKILMDILGPDEYEIDTATGGTEAIAKLANAAYDLIVMDVMMPHLSGYEVTRTIRERFSMSELPILLLTARTRSLDLAVGFQAGANDYVIKPVDATELRSRVRALTELKLSIEERLRIEAAWLQAQIQPHFLFNTINTIAALGSIDMSRMQTFLEHFSNYLRTSFDFHNSDRFVSIERELSLVQYYLFIEKERFGERLQVEWNLDTGLVFFLPPLSVQTLVENAVHHGLLRRSKGGKVWISTAQAGEWIEVSVHDNGVGMSPDDLTHLLDHRSSTSKGIGLKNTDRRLKQFYGRGLTIVSAPDQGTTVSFRIPKSKD
ncbi:ATP-binding protein [Paenibacillus chartarius]|uniref:histidine kinase n=1 Tax=Paenibacillus chartarius TaxID=747481 RepID=A0ABV6DTM6_9BACL